MDLLQQPATAEYSPADAAARPRAAAVSLRERALYGVGEISNTIKTYAFGLFLLFFYNSVLGLPATVVGLATAVGLVWDAAVDPLIGHLSDRLRPRLGRRHSFMLVGAVAMGLSFFAIFSPPPGLSAGALIAWLFLTTLLLRTSNSLFIIPYHALGAELSHDYSERTAISGTRAAFALGGTLLVAAMSFALFFPTRPGAPDPKFEAAGYQLMGATLAAMMTAVALAATLGTIGRRGGPGAEPAARRAPFRSELLLALRNRPFAVLTAAAALFFLASVINATLAINYLTHYAQISGSGALSLFQLSFYIGALAGVALWVRAARRADKQWIFFGGTLMTAAVMAAAYLLVGPGRPLGTGNVAALVGGNFVAGFFASAIWAVPAAMVADVADADQLRSGRRREGVFFGVFSFAQQMAASLAVLATGLLLDQFAGLVPGQAAQSAATADRIGMLFGLLPAGLLVAAALLILAYRLTRARVGAIQQELARRAPAESA